MGDHDYDHRKELAKELHHISERNMAENKVAVACGTSEFDPLIDEDIHSVFDRADKSMYSEKMLLKRLGTTARND